MLAREIPDLLTAREKRVRNCLLCGGSAIGGKLY